MRTFCTIVTRSFLRHALALRESLSSGGNQQRLHVLVLDASPGELPDIDGIGFVTMEEIRDPGPRDMHRYFDVFELCNAMKYFLVRYLLENEADTLIYLDADIMINGTFEKFWDLAPEKALLMTPHHLHPAPLDLGYTSEEHVADMGFINGGFAVWRPVGTTGRILEWLCSRIPIYGFNDRKAAMYSDQKLLPLLLQYFPEDIAILRHPELNIGFWNVHERRVNSDGGRGTIRLEDVVFYHLSGYRLAMPGVPCSYHSNASNRKILESAPWFQEVLFRYRNLLERQNVPPLDTTYPFDRWNGFRLTPGLRRILAKRGGLSLGDREVLKTLLTDRLRAVKRYLFPYKRR